MAVYQDMTLDSVFDPDKMKGNFTYLYDLTRYRELGWILASEIWTYASTSTITTTGDVTNKYQKGDRLWWVQTTSRYGVIYDSVYNSGTGLTTITIIINSDYSFANAAITTLCYSKASKPSGFPYDFNFVPTIVGFSSLPGNAIYRFSTEGNEIEAVYRQGTEGNSNATNFTMTSPCTAKNIANMVWTAPLFTSVNSALSTDFDYAAITANSNVVSLTKRGGWSASGTKRATFLRIKHEF